MIKEDTIDTPNLVAYFLNIWNMKKWLFTLLAGYAAGLAIAMKYRKQSGESKLESADPTKTKLDTFIDEVVDIHKTAFDDIKGVVMTTFDDVHDFDWLKVKLTTLVEGFSSEAEAKIAELKTQGEEKKTEAITFLDSFYESKKESIEHAKTRASGFADVAHDTLDTLLTEAKSKLDTAYATLKTKLESDK
jgi:gas vesicle protein